MIDSNEFGFEDLTDDEMQVSGGECPYGSISLAGQSLVVADSSQGEEAQLSFLLTGAALLGAGIVGAGVVGATIVGAGIVGAKACMLGAGMLLARSRRRGW